MEVGINEGNALPK